MTEREQKTLRIGEILVAKGVLSPEQSEQILKEQQESTRPYGYLAEKLFGVDPKVVEQAWVDQYVTYDTLTDLSVEPVDEEALSVLSRRQAWQFHILPLRYESGHLLAVTCRRHLSRAVNFAWSALRDPVCFLIADDAQIEQYLGEYYPWATLQSSKLCA